MKRKDDMAKLRNAIVIRFVITMIVTVSLDSNKQYFLDMYMGSNPDPSIWILIFLIFASFAVYIAGGFIFYMMIKKLLKKESNRRISEQNLIYAALAHDLKTPMTSVQGFARALSDGKISSDEQQEIFDIIYRKSISMNDMVETLFDYAKLGTKEYKPMNTDIDICVLVRDIVAEYYNEFEDKNQTLDIDIPEENITVNADERELKRAFTNLILNASKHNPGGINVSVSVSRKNERAVIKIADSGEPLPEGMDIFEPFVTENTARTAGHGTGLGLAITKRIIVRNGGKLYINENVEGYSKTFVAEIPVTTVIYSL